MLALYHLRLRIYKSYDDSTMPARSAHHISDTACTVKIEAPCQLNLDGVTVTEG